MSNYTEYGFEWEMDFNSNEELFIVVPDSHTTKCGNHTRGLVELTEQDLRDMLSVMQSKQEEEKQ